MAFSPAHIFDLGDLNSYKSLARDLLFVAIAVLAIGIADAFEVISSVFSDKQAQPWTMLVSMMMLIFMVPQLLIYATWTAIGVHMTVLDVQNVPVLMGGALVCAFGARLALIIGTA